MRARTLLTLALLVLSLGLFIWFFERDIPSTDDRRELGSRILPVKMEDVRAVVFETREQRVRIERAVGNDGSEVDRAWHLVEPISARADTDRIEELLRELTTLEKRRTLDSVDLKTVGLGDPRLRVKLEGRDDAWTLNLGSEIPASTDVVLSVGEKDLFVASGHFAELVEDDPGDWRARDILPAAKSEIRRIAATTGSTGIILARQEGRFVLEAPVEDEAAADEVSDLLQAIDALEVEEFLDDLQPVGDLGLESPALVIEIEIEGQREPLVIRFGAVTDGGPEERYAAVGDQAVTVETDLLELFDQQPDLWQSREWTILAPYEVDAIAIEREGQRTQLERRDGQWVLADEERSVSFSLAGDLLDAIVGLEAEGIVSREEADVEARSTILSLELASGDRSERLVLREAAGSGYIASRAGREVALAVSEAAIVELEDAVDALQSGSGDSQDSAESSLTQ